MNFQKFILTELTNEQFINFGAGVEIYEREHPHSSLHGLGCELVVVTMHEDSEALVLTAWFDDENEVRGIKRWLMTLKRTNF